MPIKLKNLLIDRVDLVGKGDNPEAHIALFKRKQEEGEETEPTWVRKIIDTVNNAFRKEGDGNIMFDFQKFLKGLNNQDLENRISSLPADVQKSIGEAMHNVAEESRDADALKGLIEKAEATTEADKLKARIAQLEQQLAEAKKAFPPEEEEDPNKKKKAPPKEEEEDVMKGLPEAIQKLLKDANDRAEAAEKIAKAAKDEHELAKFTAVAKSLGTIVTAPDKVAPVLKSISEHNAEDYKVIEAMLKAANEVMDRNNLIMKEIGTGDANTGASGSAWDQIEQKAKELRKSDSTLTEAKAIRKVMDSDPSLYEQYQKELQEGEE